MPPQITLAIGAAMSLFAIAFAVAVAVASSSSSSPEVARAARAPRTSLVRLRVVAIGAGAHPSRLNRRNLRFARDRRYIPAMDLRFWKKALKEAERELDSATRLSDVNWAAQKLMRAKEALKRLKGVQAAG